MSGNPRKILLDTNILIHYSQDSVDWSLIVPLYDDFNLSIITYMEMYAYNFPDINEKVRIDKLFKSSNLLDLDIDIANKVIEYRKQKRKKIKLPDAIILATASVHHLALLTDDWDDFQGIDEDVEIVKLERFKK
jgi:predicted nucleic acid-binding protein